MLSPTAIITIPLRSRSPSASSSRSGRAQKWRRQPDGDSITRFVGKGMLLVLTAVISGIVCYSAVVALPTPRGPGPTPFAPPEAWPKAGHNPSEGAAAAAAAAWVVPGGSEEALPGGKALGFETPSKGEDSKHPSLRATPGHAAGGPAVPEGGLVKGGPRYGDMGERPGVDLEEGKKLEARGLVGALPGEGPEGKLVRSTDPSSSTTAGEKGPQVWHVPLSRRRGAGREEEEVRQEEEKGPAREESVKEEPEEKKKKDKEEERGEREKVKGEDEDVTTEGKKAEQGAKQGDTGRPEGGVVAGVDSASITDKGE